ncbi:hypothetical protein BC826DRAFT_1025876 [Russula brevipes]|nr:hypothetical protein BC826DRAFT_1025876 [Russula brevipes]
MKEVRRCRRSENVGPRFAKGQGEDIYYGNTDWGARDAASYPVGYLDLVGPRALVITYHDSSVATMMSPGRSLFESERILPGPSHYDVPVRVAVTNASTRALKAIDLLSGDRFPSRDSKLHVALNPDSTHMTFLISLMASLFSDNGCMWDEGWESCSAKMSCWHIITVIDYGIVSLNEPHSHPPRVHVFNFLLRLRTGMTS